MGKLESVYVLRSGEHELCFLDKDCPDLLTEGILKLPKDFIDDFEETRNQYLHMVDFIEAALRVKNDYGKRHKKKNG